MSKFKVGDRVRTLTTEDTNYELGSEHNILTDWEDGSYTLEGGEWWAEDELELVPEVYLCDTCVNANVDCPIYPPKTCPSCVEYVERKKEPVNPFIEMDKVAKEAMYDIFAKPLFEPKSDKEVINEMLTESVASGETKEFKVGVTGIFKPEHEWKSVASSIDGLAEVTPAYYNYEYKGIKLDPYRVMEIWNIGHPAHQHAFKKLSRAGNKPGNELVDEIDEVIKSLVRWKEMIQEDTVECNRN